ncbi:MAG: hypothetical protein HY547_05370 [Elusimicrobia bacterium]|nr:hypothetical protein [Elusimicrobiota bacterium]
MSSRYFPLGSVGLGLLLSTAFGVIWWRCSYAIDFFGDYSLLLDCSYRLATGQTPYRDFFFPTTPLAFHLSAIILKIFEFRYQALKFFAATEGAAAVFLAVYFCRRLLGLNWKISLGLGAVTLVWLPELYWGRPWYNNTASFFALAACVAAMKFWIGGGLFFMSAAGAGAALAFWSKQDVGAGALLGCFLSAAVFECVSWKNSRGKSLISLAIGAALIFGVYWGYLAAHGAIGDWWEATVIRGVQIKFTGDGAGTGIWHMPDLSKLARALFSPWMAAENRTSLGLTVLYAAAVLLSLTRYLIGRKIRDLGAATVALMALGSFYTGIFTHGGKTFNTLLPHLGCVLGFFFLGADAGAAAEDNRTPLRRWLSRQKRLTVWLERTPRLAAVLAAFIGIYGLRYIEYGTLKKLNYSIKTLRLRGLRVDERQGRIFDEAARFVKDRIATGDYFFAPSMAALYYASNRRPPHHTAFHGWCFSGDAARVIDDLKKNRVKIFMWSKPLDRIENLPPEEICGMPGIREYLAASMPKKQSFGDLAVFRGD